MDNKSKSISGLNGGKIIIQKPIRYFTDSEKHHMIQELLSTGCTKAEIWQKYTGKYGDHGEMLRWMRKLGYNTTVKCRISKFDSNPIEMAKEKKKENQSIEDFEGLQLRKRIAELENQLKDAEMKAIAFSTMVDIAEKEFNISIRKKYNIKPSKK